MRNLNGQLWQSFDDAVAYVHSNPGKALSDGAQSLFPEQFATLMKELRVIAPAVGRTMQ